MWCGLGKTPRSLPAMWLTCSRSHCNVQVCAGEKGEKEKQTGLSLVQRGGTGDSMVERNGQMGVVCPAT